MINDETLREVARLIVAAAPGAEVVLFGSHARGDAGARSDVDLLVIQEHVENPAAESVRLRRELREMRLPVDLVVMSRRDVDEWRHVHGSFARRALAEGRVVAGQAISI
jgi:predicted nucleotidyltransferase